MRNYDVKSAGNGSKSARKPRETARCERGLWYNGRRFREEIGWPQRSLLSVTMLFSSFHAQTIRCGLRGFWLLRASKPRHLSRLVVFDLGDLATKPAEIPGCKMLYDFHLGRDPHTPHLLVLLYLN